ncbi:MAG: DUF3021 domain-containing protein [Acholeplasmatales bacterium]|nr:DUF3021 domain-containing protein [Acholeplasmatales bacterium]
MLSKGWDCNMNCYVKEFLKRGLIFSGFGPIIAGIVYLVIESSGVDLKLTGFTVFLAILTTYIIAFVQAGSSVFNQIDDWSKGKSLFFQMTSIYIVYIGGYLINNWIPYKTEVIIIFTSVYVVTFLTLWLTVYFINKNVSKKLNDKLNSEIE